MANQINSQIEARVAAFVQELTGLVRVAALEAVAGALGQQVAGGARRGRPRGSKNKPSGNKASGSSAAAPAAKRPGKQGKRGKRTPEEVEAMGARVVDHVKKNPGIGVESIAKAFQLPSKELALPILRMLAAKKLRTTGQRRGTKYFVK
ncbi:MAG: DNA-binding protein [Planctomycetes bacterium]|nr:DNA-binding protein [Planctomycetota bacterium]